MLKRAWNQGSFLPLSSLKAGMPMMSLHCRESGNRERCHLQVESKQGEVLLSGPSVYPRASSGRTRQRRAAGDSLVPPQRGPPEGDFAEIGRRCRILLLCQTEETMACLFVSDTDGTIGNPRLLRQTLGHRTFFQRCKARCSIWAKSRAEALVRRINSTVW